MFITDPGVGTLKRRLKEALSDGLVLAVKYLIVVILIVSVVGFVVTDYQKVRGSAMMGEQSYRYILAGVNAKKLPEDWTKPQKSEVQATLEPTALPTPKKAN